jgi:hypothetical protein
MVAGTPSGAAIFNDKQLNDDLKHLLSKVLVGYFVSFIILTVINELMLLP